MTHIFIVNETTFATHLEYLFAGTGSKITNLNFLRNAFIHHSQERNEIALLNDVSRVRVGDKVAFFVVGISKFFGFFKVNKDLFIEDSNNNYLVDHLGKVLTYRVLIEPDTVYAEGVTESEYLETINNSTFAYQLPWSLIYRKLKGNRGCTMITDEESNQLAILLAQKNNNNTLNGNNYTYDRNTNLITLNPNPTASYNFGAGIITNFLSTLNQNLLNKANQRKAFEPYLQWFVLNELKTNPFNVLNNNLSVDWIGNEVSCGVGMQRIDILTIQREDNQTIISIIELKDEKFVPNDIVIQLEKYIKWVCMYLVPHHHSVRIQPIVISAPDANTQVNNNMNQNLSLHQFNINYTNVTISPVNIINFTYSGTNFSL